MRAERVAAVLWVVCGRRHSLRHRRPAGAAMVEFALILPLLLLLVFGAVNFGALMFDQSVITNAAREGARWAAVHSSPASGSSCTNSFSSAPADPCQAD